MFKNIKIRHLFIILGLYYGMGLTSMNNKGEIDPAEIEKIRQEAQNLIKDLNVKEFIKDFHENLRKEKAQKFHELINRFKDQNTILSRFGKYFALYKGDIVRGGCFALDFIAEKALINKIINNKVEHILNSIKGDSKNLENLLNKVATANKIDNEQTFFNRKVNPETLELKAYINKRHKFISYNPFKLSLLPNLGLNLVKSKVLDCIEDSFLVNSYNNNGLIFRKESWLAYEKDNDGNLKELTKVPFSVVTILMYLLNPLYAQEKAIRYSSFNILSGLNKYFKLGVPNFIFSDTAKAIASVGSLGLSAKFADNILNVDWTRYAIVNYEHFLKLINRYNLIEKTSNKSDQKKLDTIEKKLKKFISKGHKQSFFSNNIFARAKNLGKSPFECAVALPVLSILAYKAYNFYKTNLR